MIVWEWLLVGAVSSVVLCPYAELVPYRTCELDGMSVVHVMVADLEVIPLLATPEITGGLLDAAPAWWRRPGSRRARRYRPRHRP